MTTRYRVEYALKTHRRDQFIEFIKGLLAVPFVLAPQAADGENLQVSRPQARERFIEILIDVEKLIDDHIWHQRNRPQQRSKLKHLVSAIGTFFTPLALAQAFSYQDERRSISCRRFVPPSFNDIRATLNTAQLMALVESGGVHLVTFDGDLTLYDDGQCLTPDNAVIPRILQLLRLGIAVGIVTAAGYDQAAKYHERLHGLLAAIRDASDKGLFPKPPRVVIVGGESNYLCTLDLKSDVLLRYVSRRDWILEDMHAWTSENISALLDAAEHALGRCIKDMRLAAKVVRKDRAVGIIPSSPAKLTREQLEETVLVAQEFLESSAAGKNLPFCAFNGGSDVFVDIGDKSWGVLVCQRFLGGIERHKTIHIGDQFLSAGANDFKARLACTTAWIANPSETVALLDEFLEFQSGPLRVS